MNTERVLVVLCVIASLTGCASLTGKDDDYTSKAEPTAGPLASAEQSPPASMEPSPGEPSPPAAVPEQSRVYESDAVRSDPSLKSGSDSKGWSVPAEPSSPEAPRGPSLNLQPSNAQPDLGIVKSEVQSGLEESESIVGGDVSGALDSARSSIDQGVASTRSLADDPFAPVGQSSGGINLKSAFPDLGPAPSIPAPPQTASPALPQVAAVQGTVRGGQPAPTFAVTTLDGGAFDLAGQKGKVVLLDFWRKTCGPCLKAMPRLAEIRSSFPEGQLMILGMNTDETRAEAESFLRTHPHHWPNVHVLSQRTNVLNPYGVRLLPTFVVIDQVGNIQYRGSDVNQVASKVSELVTSPSIPNANYMAALR